MTTIGLLCNFPVMNEHHKHLSQDHERTKLFDCYETEADIRNVSKSSFVEIGRSILQTFEAITYEELQSAP